MTNEITLRDVEENDLPIFFKHQKDQESNRMAAFISRDPNDHNAFMQHWNTILLDDQVIIKTVLLNSIVAGHVLSFIMMNKREIGYWIGREFWGKGVASEAVSQFANEISIRPLYAHVAFDNFGSIKVLEKCGFVKIGEDKYYAKARGEEIVEFIFEFTN